MKNKIEIWKFKDIELIHIFEDAHTEENNRFISKQLIKIEPDIIMFELGRGNDPIFDEFNQLNPLNISSEMISILRTTSKQVRGNFNIIINSLEYLWKIKNKKVEIYAIDAPQELLNYCVNLGDNWNIFNLTWNYIRDMYMAKFIVENYNFLMGRKVVIKCHNVHWNRIRKILTSSPEKYYDYFFINYAKEVGVDIYCKSGLLDLLELEHKILFEHMKFFENN